jgi:hypothetical protein
MGNSRLLKIRVPRTQIRGPSVSNHDPLVKPLKLVLTFIKIKRIDRQFRIDPFFIVVSLGMVIR